MRRTLAPGPFTEIAGVRAEAMLDLTEINPQGGSLDKSLADSLAVAFAANPASFTPRTIVESLTLRGAEAVASVRGGAMDGRPVVTRKRCERGWVFYVGVDCNEDEFYETLARAVGNAAGILPLIPAPYGVEVTSREDEGSTYYFLLNLTNTSHENIALPTPMDDLIGERQGIRRISLGPLGVAALRYQKPSCLRNEGDGRLMDRGLFLRTTNQPAQETCSGFTRRT